MRSLLVRLLALAITAGCDDPAVSDSIANMLQYGAVQGTVTCEGLVDTIVCDDSPYKFKLDRFQDGSTHAWLQFVNGYGTPFPQLGSQFFGKDEPVILSFRAPGTGSGQIQLSVSAGEAIFSFDGYYCGGGPVNITPSVDLGGEDCLGRNLSVFGVE